MVARNDAGLRRMVMPDLKAAVDYVVQKIWNENRELVRIMVYESYEPEVYDRTGQFKEAWETETNIDGNVARGEFRYASEKLSEVPPHHASILDGESIADYLAEVIYEGLSGAIYQHGYAKKYAPFKDTVWAKKRSVWEALNKKIGKRRIAQLFEEGMRRQGITYSRHRDGIGYDES